MLMQFQFRRYHEGLEDEGELIPGEPLWDDERGCFGVFGGDSVIHWHPISALNQYILDGSKALTTTAPTALEVAWVDGGLVIRTKSGTEIARFTATGVTLANAQVAGVYPAGVVNEIINGAFQCDRADVSTGAVVHTGNRELLFAPNWMVWCGSQASSALQVDWDTVDLAPVAGVTRSLKVTVGGNGSPASAGIRTFVHDTGRLRGTSIATVWLKGPAGCTAGLRIIGSRGLLRYEPIVGTGAWKQYTIAVDEDGVDPLGENWAALDALYCPVITNGLNRLWRVGPVEWHPGETSAEFPLNSAPDEQLRVNSIYAEPVARGDTVFWQLLRQYTKIIGSTTAIAEYDHTGASLDSTVSGRIVAARLPTVPAV